MSLYGSTIFSTLIFSFCLCTQSKDSRPDAGLYCSRWRSQLHYLLLRLYTIPAAAIQVDASAAGTAIQTPVISRNFGRSIRNRVIRPKVLKNEISADTFPLDNAVNMEEVKIFIPQNRNAAGKMRMPSPAIA